MKTLAEVERIIGRKLTPGFCPQCGCRKPPADIGKCGPCVSRDAAEAEAIVKGLKIA